MSDFFLQTIGNIDLNIDTGGMFVHKNVQFKMGFYKNA